VLHGMGSGAAWHGVWCCMAWGLVLHGMGSGAAWHGVWCCPEPTGPEPKKPGAIQRQESTNRPKTPKPNLNMGLAFFIWRGGTQPSNN
jgi:hypothetical protein